MRHIGRRAAHVKANHFVVSSALRSACHANNTACGATQNGIFAGKGMRIGEATRRLHEHQFDAWHFSSHLIDVATQDGRQISIHHRGVTPADKLHQRTGLMRRANLVKANFTRQFGSYDFVRLISIRVHEHNGHAANTGIKLSLQLCAQFSVIQRLNDFTLRRHALVCFDHFAVKKLGQDNVSVKQAGAVLISNAQCISKSARCNQQCFFTLAL